jgi:hypothetical protein
VLIADSIGGADVIEMIYRVGATMVNPLPAAAHRKRFFVFENSGIRNILRSNFYLNDHQIPIDFYGFTM